ncbi:MAG: cation acetate symporter [Rhodoferax sp.]
MSPALAAFTRWHALGLALWFLASFVVVFFARDLQWVVAGWPLGYWFAAQGSVLVFIGIVGGFAWVANRAERDGQTGEIPALRPLNRLHRRFALFGVFLLAFLAALTAAESAGLRRIWVGAVFLFASVLLYALVGIYGRTSRASDYYVAGRRVPAFYNGMAVAADWMSAASFISMAGGLYLQGFSGSGGQPGGLAYVLGWTGGYCLVALLVAPYLRRMNLYTVPDFFAQRFGGQWPRRIAAWAAILCSFTYVVAQIYGVGLITSRLTGVQFEIGILLGLGGVLVCSFLGGMRAVTWTQVTQYVVLILAFLIPVSWLAYKQLGNPLAPVVYGQLLPLIASHEQDLLASAAEKSVQEEYARRAARMAELLAGLPLSLEQERQRRRDELRRLSLRSDNDAALAQARRALVTLPTDENAARQLWTRQWREYLERAQPLGGIPRHTQAFAGDPQGTPQERAEFETSRRNFMALMFCLMVGTVGLPHVLTRFYTTQSVAQTRNSVTWSLLFIALLYLAAPALAVLVKYEIMAHLVGRPFGELPDWIAQWARVDPALVSVGDVNRDGILQFTELRLGADLILLATPEIAGLPYVASGLVAAGGLAAALSTADGLLLTIGNAISHDLAFGGRQNADSAVRRVMLSKFSLLAVALLAAYAAAQRPAEILYLVSASFSLAGAAFVPVMVLGLFWPGLTRVAAVAGMLSGLGLTLYYMGVNADWVQAALGLTKPTLWFGIEPVSAGVFGVAAGLAAALLTQGLVRLVRGLRGGTTAS